MILNIINKNARTCSALNDCLESLSGLDAVLLIEDGVLASLDTRFNREWISQLPDGVTLYVLHEDLEARGLTSRRLPGFISVDYAGMVELVVQYPLSQTWY